MFVITENIMKRPVLFLPDIFKNVNKIYKTI